MEELKDALSKLVDRNRVGGVNPQALHVALKNIAVRIQALEANCLARCGHCGLLFISARGCYSIWCRPQGDEE